MDRATRNMMRLAAKLLPRYGPALVEQRYIENQQYGQQALDGAAGYLRSQGYKVPRGVTYTAAGDVQAPQMAYLEGGRPLATARDRGRSVVAYDPSIVESLRRIGQSGQYRFADRTGVQVLTHELLHQASPFNRRGQVERPGDRFWEEGLAERAAADVAPGYARSLRFLPEFYEDGSSSSDSRSTFDFRPRTYGDEVAAVDRGTFQMLSRLLPGWEGVEDPNRSPEAVKLRRRLVGAGNSQRRQLFQRAEDQARRERERPTYARDVSRSVGRVVSGGGNVTAPAAAATSVLAAVRQVARRPAPARRVAPPRPDSVAKWFR